MIIGSKRAAKPSEDIAEETNLTMRIVYVTPLMATELLIGNTKNRPLTWNQVLKYAGAMKRGEWQLNGEPIIVDVNGVLQNGQHRLQAVVEANVTIPFVFVEGVAEEAFRTQDQGKGRRVSDVLALKGEKHTRILASAAAHLFMIESGAYEKLSPESCNKAYPSMAQIEDTVDRHPGIRDAVSKSDIHTKYFISPTALAVSRYILSTVDEAEADKFFASLTSGVGLESRSPILQLRNQLQNYKLKGMRMAAPTVIAMVFIAWNKWRNNEKCNFIRYVPGADNFPVPK